MLDVVAVVLIALAILIFLLVHFGVRRAWITTSLGLALTAGSLLFWLGLGAGPVVGR